MALILKNGQYLKLATDGSYVIYKNKAARNTEKKATTFEEVQEKYSEILAEFRTAEYRRYHEKDNEAATWREEALDYNLCLYYHITGHTFPLMKEYFPDVDDTIPEIVCRGNIGITRPTLKELYQLVKELEIFGPVKDVKNA